MIFAVTGKLQRGDGADVAVALNHRRGAGGREVDGVCRAVDEVSDAPPRRLAPTQRTANADRLAGDDAGRRAADVDRVGVHHPSHRLLVGAEVRGHHVGLRPDEGNHLLRVAACDALQFSRRKLRGVAGDPALGAAVGQSGKGALPTHPHRERGDFTERDLRVEPQAALGRPERQVMLHPVAVEHARAAVVHVDRNRDGHRALGILHPVAIALRHLQVVGDLIELLAGHPPDRVVVNVHAGTIRSADWQKSRFRAPQRAQRRNYPLPATGLPVPWSPYPPGSLTSGTETTARRRPAPGNPGLPDDSARPRARGRPCRLQPAPAT